MTGTNLLESLAAAALLLRCL